ncbi:ETEC_3214 domain-containing protein [Arthrobacter crystallopoietes]|uniref:ETEC_3214 domain-containing protein n=1 Tax=Crystallibacter crystallopoietes TaxID=37928 RepID=UPI0011110052|nr:ETEC_3214 domain-containing protein [Arthrobacter crystallopoietes]
MLDASFWNSLGLFATVFAAVAAAVPFGVAIRGWWSRTGGSRRELKRRLAKMAVGVTDEHLRSLFGVPIMQRTSYTVEFAINYVFRTNHAWIVAQVESGAVLSWSITVTDPKFKVNLRDLTFRLVGGTLGHSTFAEVVEKPNGMYEEQGAATYAYAESAYFGRPSLYQTFVFMHNQEGVGSYKSSGQSVVASGPFTENKFPTGDLEKLEDVRKATTVNTFYACGQDSHALPGGAAMWPVVHRDGVAPLRGASLERKKWLKKRTKERRKLARRSVRRL